MKTESPMSVYRNRCARLAAVFAMVVCAGCAAPFAVVDAPSDEIRSLSPQQVAEAAAFQVEWERQIEEDMKHE